MEPDVSAGAWLVTIGALTAVVGIDLAVIARRKAPVRMASAARWIGFYVSLAAGFAAIMYVAYGPTASGEFVASYVTEYSLSADNLFVFMLIIARFAVPAVAVDRVLYIGILISLLLRTVLIVAGAAAVGAFSWVFYPFGVFLLYTAVNLAIAGDGDPEASGEGAIVRALGRVLPTTKQYDGRRLTITEGSQRRYTPIGLVICAIGVANVVFAVDSIPAVFGLTKSAYVVLTANAFAMMGLRQLFFLIGDLVQRMAFLSIGLAFVLGFIGLKLILEALHGSGVDDIASIRLPTIAVGPSLIFIVAILTITAIASAVRNRYRSDSDS